MKTKIIALTLAAATAFAFTAKPASAGDKTGAVIAGAVIGGLIGVAIANNNDCEPVYVNSTYCPPAPVYVAPAPVYVADGYWNTTYVNVWVPGVWVVERDHYGRDCRRYVTGHYERRGHRVWVAHNNYNRYDYRHDRRDDRRDDRHDRRDDRRDNRRDHR
jgi:hypothetical protein